MNLKDSIKNKLKNWIKPFFTLDKKDNNYNLQWEEGISFQENLIANETWNRGQAKELENFYTNVSDVDSTSFWGSSSNVEDIRKIHINIPSLIVKTLTDISVNDLIDIEINNEIYKNYWELISKNNKFEKNLNKVVKQVLVYGDGAFKISLNPSLSDLPLISFVDAKNCEYVYEDGRHKETIFKKNFKTITPLGPKKLILLEIYGYGYIRYRLIDESMNEYKLSAVPELSNLKDIYFISSKNGKEVIDNKINLSIPFKIWESDLYENRGKSVFDDKKQVFDSLDESWSQWVDSVRKSRIQRYIPSSLLPKDSEGNILMKNDFANNYIQVSTPSLMNEGESPKVQLVEPTLQTDKYLQTYITNLDLCLQGLISPSTIGIDTKKLDNAEAQREKEKQTLYTRNNIIDALQEVIDEVVEKVLRFYCYQLGETYEETTEISSIFGEYANPSFESVIETMSKASGGKQILSFEKIVNEIYPELTDEEKAEEVERLKELNNVGGLEFDEPSLFNDVKDETINEDETEEEL